MASPLRAPRRTMGPRDQARRRRRLHDARRSPHRLVNSSTTPLYDPDAHLVNRYPVAYTILLLPVTIARFVTFSGHDVPFRTTIFADFVFNLQGAVNVIVLLATNRLVPDTKALPIYAPRQRVSMSSPEAMGITPFVLPPPPKAASVENLGHASPVAAAVAVAVEAKEDADGGSVLSSKRPVSSSTISSVNSCTPFLHIR